MKYINKFKSPNYNFRKNSKIEFIIIHYTSINKINDTISYLCEDTNKVSAHYLIGQDGKVFSLVQEKFRAWHAGVAFWNNNIDINDSSIGIELDYSLNLPNNKFSNKMINSLILLLATLKKKYKIDNKNILGHSDVAPYRKIDPGPNFPWYKLYKNNLAFKINKKFQGKISILNSWFKKHKIKTNKKTAIFILSYIGYDTSKVIKNDRLFSSLIKVYQFRFLKRVYLGEIDKQTMKFLKLHLLNLLLTKK